MVYGAKATVEAGLSLGTFLIISCGDFDPKNVHCGNSLSIHYQSCLPTKFCTK